MLVNLTEAEIPRYIIPTHNRRMTRRPASPLNFKQTHLTHPPTHISIKMITGKPSSDPHPYHHSHTPTSTPIPTPYLHTLTHVPSLNRPHYAPSLTHASSDTLFHTHSLTHSHKRSPTVTHHHPPSPTSKPHQHTHSASDTRVLSNSDNN